MSRKKKLWLHIGSNKTGSTAIQSVLHHNSSELEEVGFFYPLTGRINIAHHNLGWAVNQRGPELSADRLYSRLRKEINQSSCQNIIISSEVFFMDTDIHHLNGLLSEYEVCLICYLRRQDIWLQAMYSQHIKDPLIRETELFDAAKSLDIIYRHLDYHSVLSKWMDNLKPASMHIFPYEKPTIGEDVVEHFLKVIAVPRERVTKRPDNPGELNVSLQPDLLEFVRQSNTLALDIRGRERLLYDLQVAATKRSDTNGGYSICSQQSSEEILNQFNDSNKKLADKFSDGEIFFKNKIVHDTSLNQRMDMPTLATASATMFLQQILFTKYVNNTCQLPETTLSERIKKSVWKKLPILANNIPWIRKLLTRYLSKES